MSCPGVAGIMQFCLVTMVTAGQDLIKSIILSSLEKEKVLKEDPDVEAAVDQRFTDIPDRFLHVCRVCSADQ